MREFDKTEIFRYKCPICGSLNKRKVPIIYPSKMGNVPIDDKKNAVDMGFVLHCCNCGHIDEFFTPPGNLNGLYGCQLRVAPLLYQKCYALNDCPHTNCPLYGTYVPDKNSGYEDEQGPDKDNTGGSNSGCGRDNCSCGDNCNCKSHLGVLGDSNSNTPQLVIKVKHEDRKFV